jgi:decaprenyl-phosphate phosphoribosyltransferase
MRVAYVELGVVVAGFVLRSIAGGFVSHVGLSVWFVLAACFGALMVVAGKRSAEYRALGPARHCVRPVLKNYSARSLRAIRRLAAIGSVGSFMLWALLGPPASAAGPRSSLWSGLAAVPFALVVLRLERRFSSGKGAEPEELLYTDRTLQAASAAFLTLLMVAIYA